jgi:hypothetical protein
MPFDMSFALEPATCIEPGPPAWKTRYAPLADACWRTCRRPAVLVGGPWMPGGTASLHVVPSDRARNGHGVRGRDDLNVHAVLSTCGVRRRGSGGRCLRLCRGGDAGAGQLRSLSRNLYHMELPRAKLYVDLFDAPLDVDWPREGDELLHHMWEALGERVHMSGHSFQQHVPTEAEPYFYFGYRPTSDELKSELALVPTEAGIRAFVGILDASDSPRHVKPWADAIIEAANRINRPHPEHPWTAVIGPVGAQLQGAQVLKAPAEVAGLRIRAATTPYYDANVQDRVPSLGGYAVDVSFPVIVEGSAVGYDWGVASQAAAPPLNRLCALLSLAFDANWRVRQAPQRYSNVVEALPRSRFGPTVLPDQDDN